jgi:hypothetical protein
MQARFAVVLLAASFAFAACSNGPTDPETSSLVDISEFTPTSLASMGATHTPISFVTAGAGGCDIAGFDQGFRPNGNSGRAKQVVGQAFVVSGDLVGAACLIFDNNLLNFQGPQDFFTFSSFGLIDGCIVSREICGVWEARLPGRIELATGLANKSHGVLRGVEGDAHGTKILLHSFVQCGPNGCAEGVLLEPKG